MRQIFLWKVISKEALKKLAGQNTQPLSFYNSFSAGVQKTPVCQVRHTAEMCQVRVKG